MGIKTSLKLAKESLLKYLCNGGWLTIFERGGDSSSISICVPSRSVCSSSQYYQYLWCLIQFWFTHINLIIIYICICDYNVCVLVFHVSFQTKQQLRVEDTEERLVSQVAVKYTRLMILNLTNDIMKFKYVFNKQLVLVWLKKRYLRKCQWQFEIKIRLFVDQWHLWIVGSDISFHLCSNLWAELIHTSVKSAAQGELSSADALIIMENNKTEHKTLAIPGYTLDGSPVKHREI